MRELTELIDVAHSLSAESQLYAIASIVRVEGSAYRRPGARMIVHADGTTVGAISGGCLEQEVAAQAVEVIKSGIPVIHTFEMGEDDYIRGFGTGCGGEIQILIESVPSEGRLSLMDTLGRTIGNRDGLIVATVIASDSDPGLLGRRLVVQKEVSLESDLPMPLLSLIQENVDALKLGSSPQILILSLESGFVEVLIEPLGPLVRLLIFGDGPDVRPVVRMANEMGWSIHVFGQKDIPDLERRFPEAGSFHFLMHPEEARQQNLDARSAAIVMTHNYLRDRELLSFLIPSKAGYIGVLGPRARTDRLIQEIRQTGVVLAEDRLACTYGPAGLDIGTEAPEEIALAIVSEIQAVLQDRPAGALRDRNGPIHGPVNIVS